MYLIVDIETTGGNAAQGKIIELAAYKFDGDKIVGELNTLIDPECGIPPFISNLTGIEDKDVIGQPKFFEIAKSFLELAEGCIFVAHNVQFDFGFIKSEFASLGYKLEMEMLCTVQMARALIPGEESYSLGRLSRSLGIQLQDRHRASGDALATVELFKKMYLENGPETLHKFMRRKIKDYLTDNVDERQIDLLPKTPGVYYLKNKHDEIIYIGKSINIKKRVIEHFKNKSTKKAQMMRKEIMEIDFIETGNELMALLLEASEIGLHKPRYNQALKNTDFPLALDFPLRLTTYPETTVKNIDKCENPIYFFSNKRAANRYIRYIAEEYNLCTKLLGIKPLKGDSCSAYQSKICDGACLNLEDSAQYEKRFSIYLEQLKFPYPNTYIALKGRHKNEKAFIKLADGKIVAQGYCDVKIENHQTIEDHLQHVKTNPILNKIALQYIKNHRNPHQFKYIPYEED